MSLHAVCLGWDTFTTALEETLLDPDTFLFHRFFVSNRKPLSTNYVV